MSQAAEIKLAEQRLSLLELAQALSRGQSAAAVDTGEHRATMTPSAGGNGTVTTTQLQKSAKTVRNDR